MKTKGAISLIVLVITIIVMAILATTVIISINNTNVINEAKNATEKYSLNQMKEMVALQKASIISENDGKTDGAADPIKIIIGMAESGVITEEEKESMLANGGLYNGHDIGIYADDIVKCTKVETEKTIQPTPDESKGKILRFEFTVHSKYGIVETTEMGYFMASTANLGGVSAQERLTLAGMERYGSAKIATGSVNKFCEVNEDGTLKMGLAITKLSDANLGSEIASRIYIKFDYTDENGKVYKDCIIYSPVAISSYNQALTNSGI